MKISIRNICKVYEADIEINGITVIGGENNTGKSTVGRALFCMFNGFYDISNRIRREKIYSIARIIESNLTDNSKRPFPSPYFRSTAEIVIDGYKNLNVEDIFSLVRNAIVMVNEKLN
ncbi:MAG: AAA family ATPase [Clostridiales bacterium]|nr:AAA family ATPase [Clostridiales bacterium]